MLVRDLIAALESIAPRVLAESWDNTGLLIGSRLAPLSGPVLLTIDLTDAVLAEAHGAGAAAIIAYHPPIFEGQKRVTDESRTGRTILRAVQLGLAVYSPHTALDSAAGGMTDWLADGLAKGSEEFSRWAIVPAPVPAGGGERVKIVTFLPADAEGRVREALAGAGAGVIGAYTHCSFAALGRGSFFGSDGSNPAVGSKGRLETPEEVRLEMVCPKARLSGALAALRGVHPYEEPAIDVLPLLAEPSERIGSGRVVVLKEGVRVGELAARLRAHLGAPVQTSRDPERVVRTIGLCPGSGGSLISAAGALGCEAFVTGELKHNETLGTVDAGMSLLLAGHTQTERGYLPRLAERLGGLLPACVFRVAASDRAPMLDAG